MSMTRASPVAASGLIFTPEGRVRVYETRDAGASWFDVATNLPPVHSIAASRDSAVLDRDLDGDGGSAAGG